jgi:hypothetical protein
VKPTRAVSRTIVLALLALTWLMLWGIRTGLRVPSGLQAQYFISDAPGATPELAPVVPNISSSRLSRDWSRFPPERYRARFFGYLLVDDSGSYTFGLTSDDGATLSIDGRLVVDNGGVHEAIERTGEIQLDAGPHFVQIDYFQNGGLYALGWRWAHGDGALTAVPAWRLSTGRSATWQLVTVRILDALRLAAALALLSTAVWILCTSGRSRIVATVRQWPRAASFVLFIALAVLNTWPLATAPARMGRLDNSDTLLNQWTMAWVAHQALHDPAALFQANIFYPERDTLAYSEPLIVQSALALPVFLAGGSPVLAYNLVLIAGFALTGWAMTLVMHRWTGSWAAALIAGIVYGFNSHTLTRMPHMQAQHVYFLPLAMFALDALLRQPDVLKAFRLAVWFTLQGLTSIYLLVFTAFALTSAAAARPGDWLGRRMRSVVPCLVLAAALAALLLMPFLLPYWRVRTEQGLVRSFQDAVMYSAGLGDYLSASGRIHRATWSTPQGTPLFPGAVGLVLTGIAVWRGVAWRDRRARMCLAAGLCGVIFSLGANLPFYETMQRWIPLLQAIRAPARFGYLAILGVAGAAGFGAVEVARVSGAAWPRLAAALLVLATIDPLAIPLGFTRFDGIPPIYDRLRAETGAVVVEMPFHPPRAVFLNGRYMLNSTRHWQPQLAGYSGFVPQSYRRHFELLSEFPQGDTIAAVRSLKATHLIVHLASYPAGLLDELDTRPELRRIEVQDGIALYAVEK